ncbi:hypothetical protein Bca52824_004545 [Brassica carinata]|uniref:AT3G52170-like helix-turn-helix domain-containing protein n=1 Tax=Brassica carinata TaxID=52824 RepID=A0A8X7WQC7_BRACI|nr:hypothetical protein Bca52824_004545 [Brassica carinata]
MRLNKCTSNFEDILRWKPKPRIQHMYLKITKTSKQSHRDDNVLQGYETGALLVVFAVFIASPLKPLQPSWSPTVVIDSYLEVTVKEVGGGYYVVRDILQELKLRPNAPISRVPASNTNDASSLKQDHTLESSHDRSETVTASLDKDVDSNHLPEIQTLKGSDECLKKYQYIVITETHVKTETETALSSKDVDSKCDSDAQLPGNQTLNAADECLKNSETKDEGTLTQFVSPETKVDNLEGASCLPSETSKCDGGTLLPDSQPSMLSEECLKNSETKEEGNLTHLGIEERKQKTVMKEVQLQTMFCLLRPVHLMGSLVLEQVPEKGMVRPKQKKIQVLGAISFHLRKDLPTSGGKGR